MGRPHIDAVLGDGGQAVAALGDQRDERTVELEQAVEAPVAQDGGAGAEELLGRRVEVADDVVGIDHQHRVGQCAGERRGVGRGLRHAPPRRDRHRLDHHAACLSISGP